MQELFYQNRYKPDSYYPTRATRLHEEAIYRSAESTFSGEHFHGKQSAMQRQLAEEIGIVVEASPSEHEGSGLDMKNKSNRSFTIIQFNERTYQPGGVVAVVEEMEAAQRGQTNSNGARAPRSGGQVGVFP